MGRRSGSGGWAHGRLRWQLTRRPDGARHPDAARPDPAKLELEAQGVCTQIEKDEMAIKISNDFNEQWNIWSSDGYVMRKIVTTCIPAWW